MIAAVRLTAVTEISPGRIGVVVPSLIAVRVLVDRSLLGCFDRCEGYPIIYEFFIPEPADFVRWRLLGGHR